MTKVTKQQQQKSKMVQRVSLTVTCFILFLLVIVTTSLITFSWERKTWMNHGSHRGHRKHLVNPTTEDPFHLLREFPV